MRNSLTIRRWRIDLYGRALYVQRMPDPNCGDCRGAGHVGDDDPDPDYAACRCWNADGGIRIPLARRAVAERFPF